MLGFLRLFRFDMVDYDERLWLIGFLHELYELPPCFWNMFSTVSSTSFAILMPSLPHIRVNHAYKNYPSGC